MRRPCTKCRGFTRIGSPRPGSASRAVGRSSVRYELGIFKGEGALAYGHFVHVFVDRTSRKPVAIPDALREALDRLVPR